MQPLLMHTLLGSKNLDLSVSCLSSLLRHCQNKLSLVVFEDGTLQPTDIKLLQEKLPGVHINFRQDREAGVCNMLEPYPACLSLRKELVIAQKLFDVLLSTNEAVYFVDSDVYFLQPFLLPEYSGEPICMLDSQNAFALNAVQFLFSGLPIFPKVNTGLFYCPPGFLDLHYANKILNNSRCQNGLRYWMEQTIWSAMAARTNSIRYFNPQQLQMAGKKLALAPGVLGVHLVSDYRHQFRQVLQWEAQSSPEQAVHMHTILHKQLLQPVAFAGERLKKGLQRRVAAYLPSSESIPA